MEATSPDQKAGAILAALPAFPFAIEWRQGVADWRVEVVSAGLAPRGLSVEMAIMRDGAPVPFDGPWMIVNPPTLVEAEDGEIVRPVHRLVGRQLVVAGERRFTDAPLLAFRQMVRDFAEQLA